MIEPLNNLRNRLVLEGRYTDALDKVLIKGSQLGHGGNGTYAISRSIAVCDMPTF